MLLAVIAATVRADPLLVAATVLLVQGQIAVGPHPADAHGRTVRAPKVAAAELNSTNAFSPMPSVSSCR